MGRAAEQAPVAIGSCSDNEWCTAQYCNGNGVARISLVSSGFSEMVSVNATEDQEDENAEYEEVEDEKAEEDDENEGENEEELDEDQEDEDQENEDREDENTDYE